MIYFFVALQSENSVEKCLKVSTFETKVWAIRSYKSLGQVLYML